MGYNLEKINEISDGDTEFIEAVIVAFIEEIPGDLAKLEYEVASQNYKEIYQVSHKIKPNLDLLGMQESYDTNLQILSWSKAETNIADIVIAFESIQTKINATIFRMKMDFNLD